MLARAWVADTISANGFRYCSVWIKQVVKHGKDTETPTKYILWPSPYNGFRCK